VWGLAAALLLLHLFTANRYGIFRDEMYGLACARHLDWICRSSAGRDRRRVGREHVFGQSLLGLRLSRAAGAALVVLTAVSSGIGGGPFAQSWRLGNLRRADLSDCRSLVMMNAFEPYLDRLRLLRLRVIKAGNGWYCWALRARCLDSKTKYTIFFS